MFADPHDVGCNVTTALPLNGRFGSSEGDEEIRCLERSSTSEPSVTPGPTEPSLDKVGGAPEEVIGEAAVLIPERLIPNVLGRPLPSVRTVRRKRRLHRRLAPLRAQVDVERYFERILTGVAGLCRARWRRRDGAATNDGRRCPERYGRRQKRQGECTRGDQAPLHIGRVSRAPNAPPRSARTIRRES